MKSNSTILRLTEFVTANFSTNSLKKNQKTLLLFAIFLMGMNVSWAQIGIPSATPVVQNFDSMGASATASLPVNWKMSSAGTGGTSGYATGTNVAAVTQQASSGSPNTGARYNWGTTAATDRAIGFITSGGYASPNSIMAWYRNTSSSQINDLTISFDYERYRINATAAVITFFTSTDGSTWTARTTGDYTFSTGTSAYDFSTGTVATKTVTLSGVNIANGGDFYLRWNINTGSSNSQGVGLDNVSLTATLASAGTNYYLVSGQDPSDNTKWGLNTDGTGTNPSAMNITDAVWNVTQNSNTPTTNWFNSWTLGTGSSILVKAGTTFNIAGTLNMAGQQASAAGAGSTINATANGNIITSNANGFSGGTSTTISSTNSPTVNLDAASIVEYNALTVAQTITSGDYGNLIISGARTGAGTTVVLANGGTISVVGAFTYSATGVTTLTNTGNTFDYKGTGAQTITAFTYNNLSNSGNGDRTLASSGLISIGGTYTPTTGVRTLTGSTINFNGIAAQNINAITYNNLTYSGSSIGSLAGNVTVNGNFSQSSGTVNISNGAVNNTLNISGDFSSTGGTFNLISIGTATGATVTVTGNTSISGTGAINMESTTSSGVSIFQTQNLTTSATTGHAVDMGSGAVAGNEFRIKGNLSQSNVGDFYTSSSSASANGFVFNGTGTQTLSYTGTASSFTQYVVGSGSTLQLATGLAIGTGTAAPASKFTVNTGGTLDLVTNVISGGVTGTNATVITFSSGANIITSNATGIAGSFTVLGTKSYSSAANYEFRGASTGTFTTTPTALTVNNLTINSSGTTLGQALTLTGTLNLTSGNLTLGSNNLTLAAANAVSGTPGTTKHIITAGTGLVQSSYSTGSFTFPVGFDASNYNPVTITNNTSGPAVSQTYTVQAKAVSPALTNSLKAMWSIGGINTASSTIAFPWNSTSDISGTAPTSGHVFKIVTGAWVSQSSNVTTGSSPSYVSTLTNVSSSNPSLWTVASGTPLLTAATLASALTTTYGTASAGVSFTAAGTDLTTTITVTPQTGFEIATSENGSYQNTAITGVANNTLLWVRLASTVATSLSAYNGITAVVLSGGGASSVNITTAASGNFVAKATPVISVAPFATAITYGQTLASSTLGTGTVNTAGSFTFDDLTTIFNAGTASHAVTFTPTDTTNYNNAAGTASVTINTKALSVTADSVFKIQGATLTGGAGSTDFSSVGLVGIQTIGSVTITYGTGAAAGDSDGIYVGQVVVSDAVGGTFNASNYNITYNAGDITVTSTATISPVATTLTPFTTTYGIASAAQQVDITGTGLTSTITTSTAPTGYEVSNDGTTYGSTTSLPSSGGTLYIRLSATATVLGSYDSQVITLTSDSTTATITTAASLNAVSKATPIISVAPTATAITYGQTLASSTLGSGTVNTAGIFTFNDTTTIFAAGTASHAVTFTPTDTANYNNASGNVNVTVNKAASTIIVTGSASFTYSGLAQGPSTSDVTGSGGAVTYTYSGVTPTSYGPSTTKPTAAGTYIVVASVAADTNYLTATSADYPFTINKANSIITASGSTTFTYTGLAQGPGSSTVTGSTGAVTYSYSGVNPTSYGPTSVKPTAVGTYILVANVAADNNYFAANSADYPFAITKANQSITFTAIPTKVLGAADFGPGATSTTSGTNPITYVSGNLSVATITFDNKIHIVGFGTSIITASQAGDSNYNAATDATQLLTVTYPVLAGWDFTGNNGSVATFTATTFDSNLVSTSGASNITRGAGAAASSANNSFRTTGFSNNGILTSNTDYLQTTLTASTGNTVSVAGISANLSGTASYGVAPGVSSQFAYSLNGSTFTLIGSPTVIIGSTGSMLIDVSGISALQNVAAGTTITFRFYASGQTTTGGWGFLSASAGTNGLAFNGSIGKMPPTVTTNPATSITTTSAVLNGSVNANNNATTASFDYGTVVTATTPASGAVSGTSLTATSVSLSGLAVNTQYTYKAVASGGTGGTTNGSNVSFYTLANAPSAPVLNNAAENSIDVTIGSADGNPVGTQYAIQLNNGSYVQSGGATLGAAVWQTATAWGTTTVSNLICNTSNSFTVYARNGDNVVTTGTSASLSTTACTSPSLLPGSLAAFNAICINTSLTNSFSLSGSNLISNVTVNALTGFTFSTDNSSFSNSLTLTPVDGGISNTIYVKFTPTLAQSYSVTPISITGGGTSGTSVAVTASGINTPVTLVTAGATSVTTATSITFAATTYTQGCSSITESGIQYSTDNLFGSSSVTNGSSTVISGLSPNTVYNYRAYAMDATGTVFGSASTFTTAGLSAPIATAATLIGTTSFTANWLAVNGATKYFLDVSTSPTFGTTGVNPNQTLASNTGTLGATGWTETTVTQGSGYLTLLAASSTLISPAMNLTNYSNISLNFKARTFGGNNNPANNVITVSVSTDNGVMWQDLGTRLPTTTGLVDQAAFNLSSYIGTQVKIRFQTLGAANSIGAGIDDIIIKGDESVSNPSFVSIYNNLDVDNVTSKIVENLTTDTTYYYRVRANSTNSTSASSSPAIDVKTNALAPIFRVVYQLDPVCDGSPGRFEVDGLLPNIPAKLTYTTSSGSHTVLLDGTPGNFLIPDINGLSSFTSAILSFAGDNGNNLTVTKVERTDTNQSLDLTSGNTALLTVNANVDPTFDPIAPVCFGSSDPLPTTSTNGISGTWFPTFDGTVLGTSTYTFSPGIGAYCSGEVTLDVFVSAFPNAPTGSLDITNSTCASACTVSGGSISLGSVTNPNGSGTLEYSLNGGTSWSSTLPGYAAPQTILASVINASGCRSTSFQVGTTVAGTCAPVTAGITNNTGSTVLSCAQTSISVTATGGVSHSWSGGSTLNTAGNSFTTAGTYTVTVTGSNGCTNTAQIVITGVVSSPPNWYLDADNDGYSSDSALPVTQCTRPVGGYKLGSELTGVGTDCRDNIAGINPGASEIFFDNVDQNCNNSTFDGHAAVVVNITTASGNLALMTTPINCSVATNTAGNFGNSTGVKYRFQVSKTSGIPSVAYVTSSTTSFAISSASNAAHSSTYDVTATAVVYILPNGQEEEQPYAGNTRTFVTPMAPTIPLTTQTGAPNAPCAYTLAKIDSYIYANNSTTYGANRFEFTVERVGASPAEIVIVPTTGPYFRLTAISGIPASIQVLYGATYKVKVRYGYDSYGSAVWSNYGSDCLVTTPALAVPAVTCGPLASINAYLYASGATPGANLYEFKVTRVSAPAQGELAISPPGNTEEVVPRTVNNFKLSMLTTLFLGLQKEYNVSVRYRINSYGTQQFSGWSAVNCPVYTPDFPATMLIDEQCDQPGVPSTLTQYIYSYNVPGATSYRFRLTKVGTTLSPQTYDYTVESPDRYVKLIEFPGLTAGFRYSISVVAVLYGETASWVSVKECSLIAPASTPVGPTKDVVLTKFKATAYPNPFATNFLIDVKTSSQSIVNLKVYDMIGRLIEQRDVQASEISSTTIGDRYPSGVYNVVVSQQDNIETVRVVKR